MEHNNHDEYDNSKGFNKKFLKKQIKAKKEKKRFKGLEKDQPEENEETILVEGDKQEENDEEEDVDEEKKVEEDKPRPNKSPKKSSQNSTPKSTTSSTSVSATNSPGSFGGFGGLGGFGGFGGLGSPGGFDSFTFVNPEQELKNELDTEIHIYKLMRKNKNNRFDTIVKGLGITDLSRLKELLSKAKKKFGIGGSISKEEDETVLVFSGDYVDEIKDFLVQELGRDPRYIITHN